MVADADEVRQDTAEASRGTAEADQDTAGTRQARPVSHTTMSFTTQPHIASLALALTFARQDQAIQQQAIQQQVTPASDLASG